MCLSMVLLCSISAVAASAETTDTPRQQASLNGEWEFTIQDGPKLIPPDVDEASWRTVTVPELFGGKPVAEAGKDRGWYRRRVDIPAEDRGRRIQVYFHGVGIHSQVFVNGQYLSENYLVFSPWAVDITDAIQFGETNEILVGVETASGCGGATNGGEPYRLPNVWATGPGQAGIWFDVELRTGPAVHVADVFVQPSFRRKALKASLEIVNKSDKPAELTVRNLVVSKEGDQVLTFDDAPVAVAPGQTETIDAVQPWADPHLWFPHDPYLYHLKTQLIFDGTVVDELLTRFGFREFWVEGTHVVFNGVRAPVRRTSEGILWINPARERVRQYIRERKSWGVNNLRWHSMAVWKDLLDLADEEGMLITQEGDMWLPFHYAIDDERFWTLFAENWVRTAKFCRNHPCIFSYSIANESIPMYEWKESDWILTKEFKKVHAMVKAVDPATFIEYASGDDAWGLSPFRNWHYPNNLGARWCLPNDCYWLADNPHFGSSETPGRRDKPIIVGEDLNPSFRGPLGAYAAYGGEDYYLAGPNFRDSRVFNEVGRVVTDAQRLMGIAVINPADPCIKPSAHDICPPVAPLAKNYNQNFFAGAKVEVAYGLANEVWYPQTLTLKWQLVRADDGTVVLEGASEHPMSAGTIKDVVIAFDAPKVETRTDYLLKTAVGAGDQTLYATQRPVNVFPDSHLEAPTGVKIAVMGTGEETEKNLRALGLEFASVAAVPEGDVDLLIVAGPTDALDAKAFSAFIEKGGRALVLNQSPPGLSIPGCPMELQDSRATMAFVRRPDHPVLSGVKDNDLRWWGPDHWVAKAAYVKPSHANARVLVEAGDPIGLRWSPLLEVRHGAGRLIVCQLLIAEKLITEPVARLILQNALDFLASPIPETRATGLIAGKDSTIPAVLSTMRLISKPVTSPADDLAGFELIIADAAELAATPAWLVPLRQFVESGGNLLVKSVGPDSVSVLEPLAGIKPTVTALDPFQCARCSRDPLVSGIGQFELWWRTGNEGPATTPVTAICHNVLGGIEPDDVLVVALPECAAFTSELEAQLKTNSVALAGIALGKGWLVIDQVRWEDPLAAQIGFQYAAALLTNLGGCFESVGDDAGQTKPAGDYKAFSVNRLANQAFEADLSGSTETTFPAGLNNLAQFPRGPSVTFKGVPFDVGDRLIVLRSEDHAPGVPQRIDGLVCGVNASRLHFLHGCAWAEGKGTAIMAYRVNYADGTAADIDVVFGEHLLGWWDLPAPLAKAELAWQGRNEIHMPLCVYLMRWDNLKPEVEIRSIDFVSTNSDAIPLVLGVTAELAK